MIRLIYNYTKNYTKYTLILHLKYTKTSYMYCGLSGLRRRNEAFSLYEDEDERLWCRIPKGMLSLRRLYTSHFAIPTALLYGWLPLSSPAGASQATTRDVVQPPSLPPFPGGQKHPRCREAYYADVCTEISNTFLSRARCHVPGYNKLNTLLPKLELMSPPVDSINLSSASVDLLVVTHAEWEIAYSSPKAIRPFDSHYGIVYKSSFLCRKVFLPFKNSLQEIPSVECLTT